MKGALWLVTAVLLALARPVLAEDDAAQPASYRIVVDRVEHEPASITGTRLRVFVSALTLQGGRLELADPKSIKTSAGGSAINAPFAIGTFAASGGTSLIAVVVQATLDYTEVLPVIVEALETGVLATLDERTQLVVMPYGDTVGSGKLGPPKAASARLRQLASDGSAGDPALLDTVERALLLLKKHKDPSGATRPMRKMIVVIGDGRDRAVERERVTRLGTRAANDGVRIHAFAYSPSDQRRPMLLLGELAKRSFGTFRWVRGATAESWTPAFGQLLDELVKQYVLTYFLAPDDDPSGKKITVGLVGRTVASSLNELKAPPATCAGEPCAGYCTGERCAIARASDGRGVLGWILWIGGVVVGLLVLLGLIGFALSKRAPRIPLPPSLHPPMAPPASQPPMVYPAQPPPQAVAPRLMPHLMFLSGPRTGERVALRHGFLIGKAPGCDLLIEDGYTSSHHAQIGIDQLGNCRLYDRGSTNGTFVNGARVAEQALEHGSTIRIGSTDLRFLAH